EKTTNSVDVVKLPFNLYQNVPNPFNESTVIGFTLPDAGAATLSIYDAAGKVIKTVRGNYHSGYHEVTVQQSEFGGSGVYYYRLDTDSDTAVRKMIFIKQ
ncbi:MAG TPA: T9SS type A sorting domain-containing protein, partial [Saprospiraceae bacterium]|nr:T9SS type A sorting domain-containing protein [Saprospiraceae bacterium]